MSCPLISLNINNKHEIDILRNHKKCVREVSAQQHHDQHTLRSRNDF